MEKLLEIATTDYITTKMAVDAGADRIELCAALSEGGISPGYGLLVKCREDFSLPIFPMIRPRSGDFLYSDEEYEIMKKEIILCRQLGYEGVVFGLLLRDGNIDTERTKRLVEYAYPMEVSFHRAFDRCKDPMKAMEEIIDAGCTRILTSGQAINAVKGAAMIRELIDAAAHRIIIMPGAGVRADNIKQLANDTGAVEFHSSARSRMNSGMRFHHPSFSDNDYYNASIDVEEVKLMKLNLSE